MIYLQPNGIGVLDRKENKPHPFFFCEDIRPRKVQLSSFSREDIYVYLGGPKLLTP